MKTDVKIICNYLLALGAVPGTESEALAFLMQDELMAALEPFVEQRKRSDGDVWLRSLEQDITNDLEAVRKTEVTGLVMFLSYIVGDALHFDLQFKYGIFSNEYQVRGKLDFKE